MEQVTVTGREDTRIEVVSIIKVKKKERKILS